VAFIPQRRCWGIVPDVIESVINRSKHIAPARSGTRNNQLTPKNRQKSPIKLLQRNLPPSGFFVILNTDGRISNWHVGHRQFSGKMI
jgi:hypothetical protein